jgi:sigma-E factor negative regulatory protein RseC
LTTEEGIVIKHQPGIAWVKTQKTGACESCSAKSCCSTLGGGKEMEMETIDTVGTGVGDKVLVGFETSSLLKASFLLYIFPILCMIVGAVVGQKTAQSVQVNPSALSAVFAFLFLFLSFFVIRKTGNRLAMKNSYKPKVIRILNRGPAASKSPTDVRCQT